MMPESSNPGDPEGSPNVPQGISDLTLTTPDRRTSFLNPYHFLPLPGA